MTAALTTPRHAAFDPACRAILDGRPGVLFCHVTPTVDGAEPATAFTCAAVDPWAVVEIYSDRLRWRDYSRRPTPVATPAEIFELSMSWTDGLAVLQALWDELCDSRPAASPALPAPRLPVWFSYELGAFLEPAVLRGSATPSPVTTAPLAGFIIPRAILSAESGPDPASEIDGRRLWQRFQSIVAPRSAKPLAAPPPLEAPPSVATDSDLAADRRRYLDAVTRVQDYIRAGDVYQVNIARRLHRQFATTAGALFQTILHRHPAVLASFWSNIGADASGARHFLSFTPERLLSATPHSGGGIQLLTSPIKGTRPRPRDQAERSNPAALAALSAELMCDPKELAELNMIIDMARNDLGRVAELGSVRVESSGRIELLPYVLHRVADVTARAAAPLQLLPLLRAIFPGASVTGAPKIRAMQIIAELEPAPRGIYCGALGWLGAAYSCDLALPIRTISARDTGPVGENNAASSPPAAGAKTLDCTFGVGAGIVADSNAESEWQETLAKSRGIIE